MKRIVILGATGSGKTTFGKKLAARVGCPAVDIDELHWLPNWTTRAPEEFYRLAEEAAANESWVIMGNYSKVRPAIWPRADTLVWLDYPFHRVFWQLLRRSVSRIIDKQLICNGNIETWPKFLSSDSIMVWLFKSYWRRKREYSLLFSGAGNSPNITYVRLRSPRAASDWFQNINAAS